MDSAQDVWRVYFPEWLTVYTSDASGRDGWHEAHSRIQERYARSLPHRDYRIVHASHQQDRWSAAQPWEGQSCVQLRLPNLRGEFRDYPSADHLAADLGPGAEVVARYSPRDKAIARALRL